MAFISEVIKLLLNISYLEMVRKALRACHHHPLCFDLICQLMCSGHFAAKKTLTMQRWREIDNHTDGEWMPRTVRFLSLGIV